MASKIFLTTDETNFLNPKAGFFIPGFIPSIPKDGLPKVIRETIEKFLFYKIPHKNGEVYQSVYGLRKIETILLNAGFDCKVYSPQVIDKYGDDAEVFGVYSMDPLGIGPVTATLQGIFGHRRYNILGDTNYYNPPYTYSKFKELIETLKKFDKPILVGGPGACQFEMLPQAQNELGIDYIVIGDAEIEAPSIFHKAIKNEKLPKLIRCKSLPNAIDIPLIKKPVCWGLIEISRGCDRHCKFCDPAIKRFRWIPKSRIIAEAKINLKAYPEICLMSEDVFRYNTDSRKWIPEWGLVDLIRDLKKLPNLKSISLSHACFASALSAPEQIEALRDELNLSKENYSAVQPGVETGAIHIIKEYMPYKAAPFDPEQWHDVVVDGWKLLAKNYIYPAATLLIGLEDSEEDIQETISLMKKVTKYPGMFWPLFFSSLGTMREKHRYFVDWTQMSPSAQELYILAIKYMLKQSEKMHQHLFGTSFFARIFNHFTAIAGRAIVEEIDINGYNKGHHELIRFAKTLLKNFIQYTGEKLSQTSYNSEFHAKIIE